MSYPITALLILASTAVFADMIAEPLPRVTVSNSARFIFNMFPGTSNEKGDLTREPYGTAYKLEDNGSFREIWRVKGWYEYSTYLSNDGLYLIRLCDAPVGSEPSKEDLAVVIYQRGKLLAQFSTAKLVRDKKKVITLSSHYLWTAYQGAEFSSKRDERPEPKPYLDDENKFHLKTIDGIEYIFDATKGKMVSRKTH